MIITIPWLKEHLKTKADEKQIIHQLTNIGLEVEDVKEKSGELGEFKIAKIDANALLSSAGKLNVVQMMVSLQLLINTLETRVF